VETLAEAAADALGGSGEALGEAPRESEAEGVKLAVDVCEPVTESDTPAVFVTVAAGESDGVSDDELVSVAVMEPVDVKLASAPELSEAVAVAVADGDTPTVSEAVPAAVGDAVAGDAEEDAVGGDDGVDEVVPVSVAVPVPVPEEVPVGACDCEAVVLADAPTDTVAVPVAVPVAVFVAVSEPVAVKVAEQLGDADVDRLRDVDADIEGERVGDTLAQKTSGTAKACGAVEPVRLKALSSARAGLRSCSCVPMDRVEQQPTRL
jgi:hypothetical protein